MLKIPNQLISIARQLPQNEFRLPLSHEEKIDEIKATYGFTHGKGKSQKKKRRK